ncbi:MULTISPECIES: fibrobacter succinogenes major paralogous domain-containing protein [Mucilaginibacter]|uniref:fibrobacter succinogenes major paralogous domain-containing protein n=1 Tax=Mucilaginibacter TaxID=423349 RepID=UPI0008711ECB|nr:MULTISPECIES: fibrobacter succinogenes major paralogous domain-containing protein [Mucilaginibacter]GGB19973.1 hypothetical protein GCM10011500_40040 [Mucilaginibacter rubeus]SCW84535.1 major paralogous domain-containing protein [Mucilaginibacter sp. NFR10]
MKTLKTCLVILIAFAIGCSKTENVAPPAPVAPTFGDFAIPSKEFGDPAFKITAPKSTSDGAITYTSSNTKVATVSGETITVKSSGASVITAHQAATKAFLADSVKTTFTVGLSSPTLTDFTIADKKIGDAVFTLVNPKSKSTGAFTFKTNNPAVATVSGNKVTIVGAGRASIVAVQAATVNFKTDSITANFTVTGLKPTLGALTLPAKKVGDPTFIITNPTSNSTGLFTYKSSNTAVAYVTGNMVTIKAAGTTIITAIQRATATYSADSTKATLTVTARPIAPNLYSFVLPDKRVGDAPFTITAPGSTSAGAFTYASSNTGVAAISGNIITIKAKGQTTITATQAANGNYTSGSITAVLTVEDRALTGTVTDVDGNVYKTITIGTQTWMIENLKVTHYNDGTAIPNVTEDNTWKGLTTGAYCNYKNDASIAATYGKLYNWYAVTNTKKLAPKGFHIPTDAEWTTLYNYLGGDREDGKKIQEQGTAHWSANTGATNSTLFTALPGGGRIFDSFQGVFASLTYDAYFWSTTANGASNAWYMDLYVKGYFERHDSPKYYGYSVRCIKD